MRLTCQSLLNRLIRSPVCRGCCLMCGTLTNTSVWPLRTRQPFFRAVLWLSWLLHVTGRLTAGSSKFWFCVCTPVHWTLKATMVIAASSY